MDAAPFSGEPPALAPSLSGVEAAPRRALERIAARPFRHVQFSATQPGLRPRELDGSARRDLYALLRRLELEPAGLDFFIPTEHYLDPARVDRAVGATIETIRLAADLGRCPVSLTLPSGTDADELRAREIGEIQREIVSAAHQHGTPLADHAVPVAPRAGKEFDGLCGVGIDPVAWLGVGDDPAAAVSEHAGRIVAARLGDLNVSGQRTPPGERGGRLDVLAYGVALVTAGYQRPLIIDARQWNDPWRGFELTARAWGEAMRMRVRE